MERARGYRRRRIWVNAGFQARWTLLIAGVAAAIVAVLGTMWAGALSEHRRIMGAVQLGKAGSAAPDAATLEFDRDLSAEVGRDDRTGVLVLAGVAVALVTLLAWVAVRLTFRAAGPVFAVSRMLDEMARGDFGGVRPVRGGDDFRSLGEAVVRMRDALRREAETDAALLARVAEALRAAGVEALAAEAEAAATAKRERFGGGEAG